jgi:hypothetical protein
MSILAILVAAVAAFAVGSLWYSPYFLGKPWARLANVDMKGMGIVRVTVAPFLCFVIVAYVLSMILASMGAYSGWQGAEGGFWVWLGFVLPFTAMKVFYESRSIWLVTIDLAYYLLALMVMGAILAAW